MRTQVQSGSIRDKSFDSFFVRCLIGRAIQQSLISVIEEGGIDTKVVRGEESTQSGQRRARRNTLAAIAAYVPGSRLRPKVIESERILQNLAIT